MRGRWWRRMRRVLLYALLFLALAVAAVWLAVRVTPMQSVSAAGQTVQVGAAANPSLSGPGELELFGQVIPTRQRFPGPIRPRLKLTHITIDAEVAGLLRSGDHGKLKLALSRQLVDGWRRYALWETLIAAGFGALIVAAVAGFLRRPRARLLGAVAVGVAAVCAVNAGSLYGMAADTPRLLRQVRSLGDLVGRSPPGPPPKAEGPALTGVQAVVIGDSTAAAAGNPLVDHPSPLDRACGRSKDSYAVYLATVNHWNVLNLACDGATIRDGVLGVQILGSAVAPAQLSTAERATSASLFMVSIGANDVHWADLTKLCAAGTCGDRALTAYFQKQLADFARDYYALLRQLAALPQHPAVLVNEYYDPFGEKVGCLGSEGITPAKARVLRSWLTSLNAVLAKGAQDIGFTAVPQHFAGRRLCSGNPFVQGPSAKAPLHPTAAGELAIALADQQALRTSPPRSHQPPPTAS